MTSAPRTRHTPAFSLIEVTLSLAVVSFALLSVLALLPLGLKMMQEAQQQQAIGNIINEIRGQAQEMSQSDITTAPSATPVYYDASGSKELAGLAGISGGTIVSNYYYEVTTAHATPSICTNTFNSTNAVNLVVTITYPISPSGTPYTWSKTITNTIFAARQSGN